MGHRTLKRVPLDFSWPLHQVWGGYRNPFHPPKCVSCDGSGYNPETKKISDTFYNFDGSREDAWKDKITQDEVDALLAKGRLYDFTEAGIEHPTAEQVNAWERHDPSSPVRGLGHDAINRWILIETRATRLGVWDTCKYCKGEGVIYSSPEHKKMYEEWTDKEPPVGEGYQLWETCSEGSPVSPVFSSAEELASWCAAYATVFAHEKTSYENWLKMFREEDGVDAGSYLIATPTFFGAAVNQEEKT